MGFLSHRVDRSEIKPGDHIYTWRAVFSYSHHGIYVGGNEVVHFTCEENTSSDSSLGLSSGYSSSTSSLLSTCLNCPECGFRQPGSGVVLSCLDCFLRTGSLYQFEYGVKPCIYLAKFRGGTCTTAKSDPPQEVIHRAMHLLQNGFGHYDVFRNNCEDFALYCKTGLLSYDQTALGRSGQAACVVGAPLAAILSAPFKLFMATPVGAVTAAAGMYCLSRYACDIGVRVDVVKVKVEDMALFHGCHEPVKESIVEDDSFHWKLDKNGFSVSSYYRSLMSETNFRHTINRSILWNPLVEPRIRFFFWCCTSDEIPTFDRLKKRGLSLANKCCLCDSAEENIDHLFVGCSFASAVWSFIRKWLQLQFPLPDSLNSHVNAWKIKDIKGLKRELFYSILQAACWFIWKERNNRLFTGKSRSAASTFENLFQILLDWYVARADVAVNSADFRFFWM